MLVEPCTKCGATGNELCVSSVGTPLPIPHDIRYPDSSEAQSLATFTLQEDCEPEPDCLLSSDIEGELATLSPTVSEADGLADELKAAPIAAMGTNKVITYELYERILAALSHKDTDHAN